MAATHYAGSTAGGLGHMSHFNDWLNQLSSSFIYLFDKNMYNITEKYPKKLYSQIKFKTFTT